MRVNWQIRKWIKEFKNWLYPHRCTKFQHYYSKNLKICCDCKKTYPLWDVNIKHQR